MHKDRQVRIVDFLSQIVSCFNPTSILPYLAAPTLYSLSAAEMEGATPHFPRDHFTRYTSPESLPAYHPPYGYLSPPYSSTRSPTTEVRLASSPAGLGISQCTFEPHYEHQRLHDADSARANLSFRTDQGFYRTGAMALPSQLVPRSPYTASPGCPSYYPTPRHRCPPAQPPHNTLVDFQREDTHSHLNFFNQPVHSSSENPVASNHIRYQTDPMQDGKWTVPTQRAVHSLPETRSDTLVWEHTALQHYAYSEHYMVSYQRLVCTEIEFSLTAHRLSTHRTILQPRQNHVHRVYLSYLSQRQKVTYTMNKYTFRYYSSLLPRYIVTLMSNLARQVQGWHQLRQIFKQNPRLQYAARLQAGEPQERRTVGQL